VGLEVNMRPPGGLTMDMFNYANDIDLYREWAHIVAHNRFTAKYSRPYHCCFAGRRTHKHYAHSHQDVVQSLGSHLVHHEPINSTFGVALGDYGYLFRTQDLDQIHELAGYILELA
jgi:hypothetical protein